MNPVAPEAAEGLLVAHQADRQAAAGRQADHQVDHQVVAAAAGLVEEGKNSLNSPTP